jgi:hypothetical protein
MTRLPCLRPSRCAGGWRGPRRSRATPRAAQRPALQGPAGQIFCRSAPCARTTYGAVHPSVAVAHKVRSYKGEAGLWMAIDVAARHFVGAHPVRDKPTERYTQRGCRAQGALPQTSPPPGAARVRHVRAKADAQRGPALSPQRHGALRSAWNYPLCSGGGCQATTCLKRSGLSLRNAASSSGHSLWVTFLLGQQEKSDSSGGSRSKRPPRRRHAGLEATIEAQSHWIPAFAGMTIKGGNDDQKQE